MRTTLSRVPCGDVDRGGLWGARDSGRDQALERDWWACPLLVREGF